MNWACSSPRFIVIGVHSMRNLPAVMKRNVKCVSGSCEWVADTCAPGRAPDDWQGQRRSPDWLRMNQEKPGRNVLFTGMFFYLSNWKRLVQSNNYFFFFLISFFDCTPILKLLLKFPTTPAFRCSARLPDSDWRSDRKCKKTRIRHGNGWDGIAFLFPSALETTGLVTKRQSVPSTTWRLLDDMQEHDAPVDISAVPIRLMNHARLLKALQRGPQTRSRQPRSHADQRTVIITADSKYSHIFI